MLSHAVSKQLKLSASTLQTATFAILLFWTTADSNAQPPEVTEDSQRVAEQRLATDRKATQTLKSFRRKLADGGISGALDDLEVLRFADPHSLVPASYPDVFVPLYRAVFDAFYEIPASQRKQIEESLSVAAGGAVAELAQSQPKEIPAFILRNAGTPAAANAHLLAARLHLSRGNYTGARNWLLPISRGHLPEEIRKDAAAIMAWLERPEQRNSNVAESASDSEVKLPKYLAWQARSAMSPKLQKQIATFLKAAHAAKIAPQTIWQDIIENDSVYRRTLRGLTAIDMQTGTTKWEYPIGDSLDSLILGDRNNAYPFNGIGAGNVSGSSFQNLDKSPLANVFCRDNSSARIAADSRNLYLVANQTGPQTPLNSFGIVPSSRGFSPGSQSRLVAVEKATGRRVWTMGQTTLEEALGTSPTGCWIAGPPEADGRRLYSVFEWNGEMRLGCIDAETGELQWSARLAYPEQSIDKDGPRRFWGATPRRSDGLVWCPTTTGWLVCVDEVTQSAVYAAGIKIDNSNPDEISVGRNQALVFTKPVSLTERWSVARMIPSEGRLSVISHETRDIVVLDAATGERMRRIAINPGEFCLYADETQIVVTDAKKIRALQTGDAKPLWEYSLDSQDGYPIGEATRKGQHILIPMSDGSVAQLNLQSGEIVAISDVVLPLESWGRLESSPELNGDLLYLAPERVSRISANKPDESPDNPLEIASGLMAAGKWEEALATAGQVPESDLGRTEAESIIFSCRLQLAAADPVKYLAELSSSNLNAEQSMQVQVFEAASAFNSGSTRQAADKIVDLLLQSPVLGQMNVPAIATLWKSESETEVKNEPLMSVKQSLLTWTAMRFAELAESSPDLFNQERFSEISNDAILAIDHPLILPELHSRMKAATSEELFWHLLQNAVSIQSRQAEPDLRAEISIAEERHNIDGVAEKFPVDAMRLLLATSYRETSPEFQACVDRLQPHLSDRSDDRNASLTGQFSQWTAKNYKPVPVSRSQAISSRVAQVNIVEREDLFLGEYNWSVMQGEWGRLVANRITDLNDQWSIPGNFQVFSNYSMYSDLLHRVGTVVLLKTSQGLTAVSSLDQRVLWTRSPNARTSTGFGMSVGNFDQYVAGRHYLPSHHNFSAYQIVGSGHRWICIRTSEIVELLDMYSGRLAWSANLDSTFNRVIATDDFVILGSTSSSDVQCFDRRSGMPVSLNNAIDFSTNTIRNVGAVAVTWKEGGKAVSDAIEWVNPATGAVVNSVSLTDMDSYHFMDDRTLVGVSRKEKFMVVDLISGTSSVYSFDIGDQLDAAKETEPDKPANGPPNYKLWDHQRIQVTADPLNYYVSNRVSANAIPFRQSFGRASLRFEGDLRAIDRTTGDLRWVVRGPAASVATTDQPELPILVMWDDANQMMGMLGKGVVNIMRGYDKLTGEELFRQHIPSRYGWRFVQLESPEPNVIDVTVYGTKLRLAGQPPE